MSERPNSSPSGVFDRPVKARSSPSRLESDLLKAPEGVDPERKPAPMFRMDDQPPTTERPNKDSVPVAPVVTSREDVKPNFPDPFAVQYQMRTEVEAKSKALQRLAESGTAEATKAQEALNNQGSTDFNDDDITAEDMKLAEQLIFKGYAETNVAMASFPDHKFTICSTNAEEMSIIDEMAFDMIKTAKDNKDGTVDLPENHIRTMRNALLIALSYRGVDQKELMDDPICYLNTLKKAILRVSDLLNDGKIEDAVSLKGNVKTALTKRATTVKRLPTPMIDFLSNEKYKFDTKMFTVMNMKGIIPKS